MVRIYLESPTFDRITRDQSSKLEDKISTIGGNLGLLTGFSIISAVEIIYFAVKSVFKKICGNVTAAENNSKP